MEITEYVKLKEKITDMESSLTKQTERTNHACSAYELLRCIEIRKMKEELARSTKSIEQEAKKTDEIVKQARLEVEELAAKQELRQEGTKDIEKEVREKQVVEQSKKTLEGTKAKPKEAAKTFMQNLGGGPKINFMISRPKGNDRGNSR